MILIIVKILITYLPQPLKYSIMKIAPYVKYHLRFFFFQAEDGIRDLVRSRGLGYVYKRQVQMS